MSGRRPVDLERAARAVQELLAAVGAPLQDPELAGTGRRVAETWAEDLLCGYDLDPAEILADATASRAPGTVVVTGIATTTICPHHLMPATGLSHVGYVPGGRVVGLGALARLVDCFSRRLTLQEDLARNVAGALVTHLGARAAGCVVSMAPTCMVARGERRHGARAVAHAWAGEADEGFRRELLASLGTAERPVTP